MQRSVHPVANHKVVVPGRKLTVKCPRTPSQSAKDKINSLSEVENVRISGKDIHIDIKRGRWPANLNAFAERVIREATS
jgi:hypothetical protein